MNQTGWHHWRVIPFLFLFWACENDMEKVNLITQAEEQAQEVSKDIDILYSDSAAIKVHLTAPVMNHFAGDNPRLEFPAGLHVEFFDSIGEPSANLSSRYAVRNINEKKIILGILVLLYFVSPIDIIPDFIPFIGKKDDIFLLKKVSKGLDKEILKYKQWRKANF